MAWNKHAQIQLDGLKVELSEPVLVKRSRWYCWFPSLIRQPDGTLWAVISANWDLHVTGSINYLSRSRDGGFTWDEPRILGDAGLNHLILPDGSALVLPYYIRPRGDGAAGAVQCHFPRGPTLLPCLRGDCPRLAASRGSDVRGLRHDEFCLQRTVRTRPGRRVSHHHLREIRRRQAFLAADGGIGGRVCLANPFRDRRT